MAEAALAGPDDGLAARLHERDLAGLWERGTLPPAALVTLDGTPLRVVYRGRPNAGAGPDFRDAVLALPDGTLLHGDVELHLRASDFRRHGHDRDPAYDRVVLHLVSRGDDGPATRLHNGRRAPVVALERWLAVRAAELEAMLHQPALWREPCESALDRIGREEVERILARLGERRLRARAAMVASRPAAAALYERLLRTLGQGPQRPAWIELARRLPPSLLARAQARAPGPPVPAIEALFLGAAGLLAGASDEPDGYLTQARRLWQVQGAPASVPILLAGSRRPANHPARRLAGLARLLADGPEPLLAQLRRAALQPSRPELAIVRLLTVPADGPWRDGALAWGPRSGAAPALIGAGKALELALNAALPVLLRDAEREGQQALAAGVLHAFHALPSPPAYGSTAHLYRALGSGRSTLLRRADHSQATLYLSANYCTRGGCGRCPLS